MVHIFQLNAKYTSPDREDTRVYTVPILYKSRTMIYSKMSNRIYFVSHFDA